MKSLLFENGRSLADHRWNGWNSAYERVKTQLDASSRMKWSKSRRRRQQRNNCNEYFSVRSNAESGIARRWNWRAKKGCPTVEVGCCTPPRSIFYNMDEGVAGRLGVAYRRHADVRRSANDWSIVTRRFSLRLSLPFASLSLLLVPRTWFTRACQWSYADPTRGRIASPPTRPRFNPQRSQLNPWRTRPTYRSSSSLIDRSSRVDLFTVESRRLGKNGEQLVSSSFLWVERVFTKWKDTKIVFNLLICCR